MKRKIAIAVLVIAETYKAVAGLGPGSTLEVITTHATVLGNLRVACLRQVFLVSMVGPFQWAGKKPFIRIGTQPGQSIQWRSMMK
jgi:hypothetical protein